MDKREYLSELERYLVTLPPQEKNMHLEHYGVILAELENSGKDLVEKLGTPKELATEIVFAGGGNAGLDESYDKKAIKRARKQEKREKKRGGRIFWKIVGGFILLVFGINLLANIVFNGKVIYWDKGNNRIVISEIDKGISEGEVSLDKFSKLDIDADYASIYLIPAEDYAIEYHITGQGVVPYSLNNDKLVINDNGSSDFRLSFNWFSSNDGVRNDYINIYYPEGTSLEDLDVNLNMGSFSMENLTVDDMNVDLDMGELSIADCRIKNCDSDLDMGSIDIKDSKLESFKTDLDMGGLDASNVIILDSFSAGLDMGSVNIDLDEDYIDDKDGYFDYNLETDMGSIDIDGKDYGKKYDESGDVDLEISCDMGSINIKY